ncbi:MAG TPA: DUF58 domain-containing protein [Gammaproteobacteria bacterium]
MRFTPAPLLVILALLWAALGITAAFFPDAVELWQGGGLLLGASAFADWQRQRQRPLPVVGRRLNRNLPVGVWSTVTLELRNTDGLPLHCTLHDMHPSQFEVRHQPWNIALAPGQWAELRYQVRPPSRGAFQMAGTSLLLLSPWRLWRERRHAGETQQLRVYPNFAEIAHYTLLATDNRLSQMGVRRRQRRGTGSDFHQLREYRVGDSLRQIDWKATSRYRKTISREYQDERDQQILFLVDCGRRMHHVDAGHVHLDEALNAVLLLSYVSLHQGDAVGFMTFGGVRRWFAPRKGPHVVNALLNATYDLQSTTEAADYRAAASELLARQRRRALVVLITNTRDEDHADLEAAVKLLRRRHLVLVADLREALLDDITSQPVQTLEQALLYQATEEYLALRRQSHERLSYHGARLLDLRPAQLPVALVNRYFEIKQEGAL